MSAHWDDLKTVMHLVRGGSLAVAANALDVSYTTVARRVKRIEDDLGVQLFERLSDGYSATEAGEVVAGKAALMEVEEHDLMRSLLAKDTNLSGRLTVTAPQLLCASILGPVFKEFSALYPDVELIVRGDNSVLDLNRREADLAIRISNDPGDSLRGRRLSKVYGASYGSVEMARHIRENPDARIDWVVNTRTPNVPDGISPEYTNHNIRFQTDDFLTMVGAAREGSGLVFLPMFLGEYIPELEQIPVLLPREFSDIWMVAHRDVWVSARVAAFREVLVPHFKSHQHLFGPEKQSPR